MDKDILQDFLPPRPRRVKRARQVADVQAIASAPLAVNDPNIGYLASQFIICTLPHSDPGDVPVWTRRDGFFTLSIKAGCDDFGVSYGLPYGSIPRLVLVYLMSEAIRTGSPVVDVGLSFAEFLRRLGYSLYTGGGRRGDAVRVRDQISRLFNCLISFEYYVAGTRTTHTVRFLPVEAWALRFGEERSARIELGRRFWDLVKAHPVPLDLRVLEHFKQSPMALDVYACCVRDSGLAQGDGRDRFVAWEWLHKRLGADYVHLHHFRAKVLPVVQQLITLCPGLLVSVQRGGRGRKSGLLFSAKSQPVPRSSDSLRKHKPPGS